MKIDRLSWVPAGLFVMVMVFGVAATANASSSGAHWGYTGDVGPAHWGALDPTFEMCAKGKNQAPIDITGAMDTELAPIQFAYGPSEAEILNNGHTVQVNLAAGNQIMLNGRTFHLKQFHFHTPSENTVNGKFFAMEAHLVHADADGNLAVIGVMFNKGDANPVIASLWAQMPKKAGAHKKLEATVDPMTLLPAAKDHYRFNGSLTTPPCSEGVFWLVMKNALPVSSAQADAFTALMHGPNNRPVQPINARPILE
ncbi:Carbonic anhydrase [Desulfosarcina cetonica]|nr:Carbonic anhydrase [Desulfosarcina cetonica]